LSNVKAPEAWQQEGVTSPGDTSSGKFDLAKSIKALTNFLLPSAATSESIDDLIENRTIRMKSAISSLKERKMRKEKLVSAILYICFILMYFGIVLEQRKVQKSFNLEYALADRVTNQEDADGNTFKDLQDLEQMWTWIETAFLPGILDPSPRWYNGVPLYGDETEYFLNYNRLIGGIKIGLRRVDPCSCKASFVDYKYDHETLQDGSTTEFCVFQCSERFNGFYPVLYPPLTNAYQSRRDFGPDYDVTKYTFEDDVYGGGYFIYMGSDPVLTNKVFQEIKSDLFIDKASRKFEITFNVFNGNYQLFTSVILVFEFAPTGLMDKSVRFGTFAVEPYLTTKDKVRAGFEVLFTIFVFCCIGDLIYDVYKEVMGITAFPRLRSFWFWMDVVRNVLFLTSIIQWILIVTDSIATGLELPLPHATVYYDLEPLLKKHAAATTVNAFSIVVCLLGCFKYFHYSPKYGILVRTISHALPDLLQFMYMFATVFMVFGVMGMMMFGHVLREWSSFFDSVQTLIMMLTVEYGMAALVGVDVYMGTVFYFFFLIIAYFLLVNILLAILIDAYTALNEENRRLYELELDTLNVKIPREIVLQTWFKIVAIFKQVFQIKASEDASFFTIEMYLNMLENTAGLATDALLEEVRPTVVNPHPEPELVLTYSMLLKHFSKKHASLMMAALGSPIPAEVWQRERAEGLHGNKLQAARAEVASVNAFKTVYQETQDKKTLLDGMVEVEELVVLGEGGKTLVEEPRKEEKRASWISTKKVGSNVTSVSEDPTVLVPDSVSVRLMAQNKELKVEVKELGTKLDLMSDMMRSIMKAQPKASTDFAPTE